MSLQERLMEDMKDAMRAKEEGRLRLSVIRMTRAALKNEEIASKAPLTDEQAEEVIFKELKTRRESLLEFEKANRPEEVQQLKEEIDILMDYLPEQLSEEEIFELVKKVVDEVNPKAARDQGQVMAKLMPLVKGKADGRLVGNMVKEMIAKKIAE